MTWNSNIPLAGNQLGQDWPDINENFTHLKNFLANIVNSWDNITPTNMFIAKTKRTALTSASSPYTMLATDVILEVDASGGAVTINALSAATLGAGRFFIVKVTDASNNVTIDPDGSETIDGESTLVIDTARSYIIYSDGSNLQIMGSHITSDPTFNSVTVSGSPSGSPSTNKIYKDNIVKAWINFNGSGTISIDDSYNISSITDIDTGWYKITFDTDFANTDYCAAGMAPNGRFVSTWSREVGSLEILVKLYDGTAEDMADICVIVIGDQ